MQVQLKKPYSPFLSALSQGYFGILSPAGLARGTNANCVDPIGSGPFILQAWNHGQNLVFVRNPNYNSAPANALHQGPAYVDKLVWSFVADPTTRWASLTSGQNDVIEDVPTVDWQQANSAYNVQLYVTPGRPETLLLNTVHGVFADQRVRQAFAYAGDRQAAVQSAFEWGDPLRRQRRAQPVDARLRHRAAERLPLQPVPGRGAAERGRLDRSRRRRVPRPRAVRSSM